MFTGLIETTGAVVGVRPYGKSVELCVRPGAPGFIVGIGASVAVDGVCLTLERRGLGGLMFFTAVAETLGRTTLAHAAAGRKVNLERALLASGRFDGHIVLGHVDAVGRIVSDERVGASLVRTVRLPDELSPFIAEKGSIAIDGVSLTIAEVKRGEVSVSLIPATVGKTAIAAKGVGGSVNIECDVLAKYMYGMIKAGAPSGLSSSDIRGAAVSKIKMPTGKTAISISRGEEPVVNKKESLIDKMERLGF
ncbi:MAG: riboflavin synthase [Chitinispirillales bacterium]|jgi:riboflavin synthase|nr:riboflavin synthase [Chitinispirillales bacterium]